MKLILISTQVEVVVEAGVELGNTYAIIDVCIIQLDKCTDSNYEDSNHTETINIVTTLTATQHNTTSEL